MINVAYLTNYKTNLTELYMHQQVLGTSINLGQAKDKVNPL